MHLHAALLLAALPASILGLALASPPQEGPAPAHPGATAPAARPAVLVTGASSGIGRATAELLATNGFHVYAGARKAADLEALQALDHVDAVKLDVTDDAQIAAAVKQIEDAGRGLHGLINNAGVLVMAPLVEVTPEDLAFQMDVNVTGPYRVTKAFTPLLIESKGHVLTTGSISGFVTWGFGGPYTMSKHAVEAYTDCLAMEMEPHGVRVSVIEPGNFRSDIMSNMVERLRARGYAGKGSLFEGQLDRLMEGDTSRRQHADPVAVARVFLEALEADQPARRYMVTPNAGEARRTLAAALERVAELNANSSHPVDDEALHRMLDQALEGAR